MKKTPEGRQAQSGVEAGQMYLFPPPPFSPIWPKRDTLAGRALALLLEGHTLTHLDFLDVTGSWRLSEPVRALRNDFGWPVASIDIPSPTPNNRDRLISRYYLPDDVLEEVGVRHE